MTNDSKRRPQPIQGRLFALFLIILIVVTCLLFSQRNIWLPQAASEHGHSIDRVFMVTLIVAGVLFILLQAVLAFMAFRFGKRNSETGHWISPHYEKRFVWIAALIIFSVDVTLYGLGE